jgi:hypothetical protein
MALPSLSCDGPRCRDKQQPWKEFLADCMASKSSQIVTEERYANLLAYHESNSMPSAVVHFLLAEGKALCENDDKFRRRHKVHWLQYGETVALYAPNSFYKNLDPEKVREYDCRLHSVFSCNRAKFAGLCRRPSCWR